MPQRGGKDTHTHTRNNNCPNAPSPGRCRRRHGYILASLAIARATSTMQSQFQMIDSGFNHVKRASHTYGWRQVFEAGFEYAKPASHV